MERGGQIRTIGLWGHYHGGNQGDECVVSALIRNIRARLPGATIVGFSLDPDDTRRRHGIPAYPIRFRGFRSQVPVPQPAGAAVSAHRGRTSVVDQVRRVLRRIPVLRRIVRAFRVVLGSAIAAVSEPVFLYRSYRTLRRVDLLVVAGSGPLSDDMGGPWSHPYTVFKWAVLSRMAGTRFALVSVGAGPIDAALSRVFVRAALRIADYCSVRDPSSARLLERLSVGTSIAVLPDLAFSLDLGETVQEVPGIRRPGTRGVVGLNPLPHFDGRYLPKGDLERYRGYVRKMARFAMWLLGENFTVALLSSQLAADPKVCADVIEEVRVLSGGVADERLVDQPILTFEDLVRRIAACDYVVAARFHCIILPFILGRPVVALAYHPKTPDLMAYMGQSDFTLDINEFEPPELIERFRSLQERAETIKVELAARVARHRQALSAQYDQLFGSTTEALRLGSRGVRANVVNEATRAAGEMAN